MSATVVPIPLWRSTRRTGVLLAVLGTLVLLFGIAMIAEAEGVELEAHRRQDQPAPDPVPTSPPSTSNPPTTSS